LFGDVVAVYDVNATKVLSYEYTAYGLCYTTTHVSGTHASLNPFRYRGYYYDSDLGLYYLNSRYYDARNARFISADDTDILQERAQELLGSNLFSYCDNNPINLKDPTGESPANIIGGILGGATGAALGHLLAKLLGLKGWKKWALIAAATVGGATLGAFLGPYIAKLGSKVAAKLGLKATMSIPKYGTQIGKLGKLTENLKPIIQGTTKHGLERMTERGITQVFAQNIIQNGYAIAQSSGKTLFFTEAGVVVLNKFGEIVTAYTSQYFDSSMKQIISQFFGG